MPSISGVRVIRRERENAARAGGRRLLRQLRGNRRIESGAGNHRHLPRRLLDRDLDDLQMLGRRQRVDLARAARRDHGADRMLEDDPDVRAEPGGIQRQVGSEGRHREGDHAVKGLAQRVWGHGERFYLRPRLLCYRGAAVAQPGDLAIDRAGARADAAGFPEGRRAG